MNTENSQKKNLLINLGLVIMVIFLVVLPLVIVQNSEFSGSDSQAEGIISQLNEGYKPWFAQIWSPPSGEVESMLFAVQAAIGSGILFFCLGYLKGRSKGRTESYREKTDKHVISTPAASHPAIGKSEHNSLITVSSNGKN